MHVAHSLREPLFCTSYDWLFSACEIDRTHPLDFLRC